MHAGRFIWAAVLAAGLGIGGAVASAQEEPVAGTTGAVGTESLDQFSKASQALYKRVASSLVRVRIDQGVQGLLTPAQRKEFVEWARAQATDAATTQPDSAVASPPPTSAMTLKEQRRQARQGADAATQPAIAVRPLAQLFRRFAEQKANDTQQDAVTLAKWKQIWARLQQPIAETTGVVIDDQGDAVVLGGWLKDGPPMSLRVIGVDGTEMGAKYVGGHPGRGMAIIKLESPGAAAPLSLADAAPAPGELLMCVAANSGGVGWVCSPGQGAKKNGDDRFALLGGEDRGPNILFNTNGQLAAVGFERFAVPVSALKNDVKWILANKKDVAPRQLGVSYVPVPPLLRRQMRMLANRPAVVVKDVAAGSLAEKAGLQKNDIVVTIDRKSIWQMPQIQWDLATETGSVPIGIVRGDKEETLSMPLD